MSQPNSPVPPPGSVLILRKWLECSSCKGTSFNVDFSFTNGQFICYRCTGCKTELNIAPDLQIGTTPDGKVHCHINWMTLEPAVTNPAVQA